MCRLTLESYDLPHRNRRRRRGRRANRQPKPDIATCSFLTGDLQRASQQSNDPLADVQTEADSATRLIIVSRLIERLAEMLDFIGRYAPSGIADLNSDTILHATDSQSHFSFFGKFDGITNQVVEHLFQTDWIGGYPLLNRVVG